MARQNRTKAETVETPEVVEVENTDQENTVTEPTEAPTEAPEVNLDAFKAAVANALAEGDSSTGQLPETAIAAVNVEYRGIDGTKGKGEARKFLDDSMLDAVGKLDAVAARGYSDLKSNLSAAGGTSKVEKAPADPAAAFVQRMAALQLAIEVVHSEAPEVEGRDLQAEVNEAVSQSRDLVKSHLAWVADESEDKGEAPELTPVVRAALKAATGKATGGTRRASSGGSGIRRDVAAHIASAFADVESGTFLTVAEIAKHKSAEYGDDSPSQGAVSARLFPANGKMSVEGVEPVEKGSIDGKNPKGARKA